METIYYSTILYLKVSLFLPFNSRTVMVNANEENDADTREQEYEEERTMEARKEWTSTI